MCGHDWCSVRISKEIQEFASGKADAFQWDRAKVTDASVTLSSVRSWKNAVCLSPAEIHRLASKTRRTMGAEGAKAECHSDLAEAETARTIQLVQLGTSTP
jgi:phosphomethylpyrimidine synthase